MASHAHSPFESGTWWAYGAENRPAFKEDKRFMFSGGYLPNPGSVWLDQSETVTAGASGDDYTPLSQLRSRTEARQ